MGRRAEGWKLRWRGDVAYVRFRHEGTRYDISTRQRNPGKATAEAARIYADVIAGRWRRLDEAPAAPTTPLVDLFALWLESLETTHAASTRKLYEIHVSAHLLPFFETYSNITTASIARYTRERLGKVLRATVRKERSSLADFLAWTEEEGIVAEAVQMPPMPRRAAGTKATKRKTQPTDLTVEELEAVLAELPEWSSDKPGRFIVRAYLRVSWETGLRPSTMKRLRAPEHYRKGQAFIDVAAEIDKAKFGRRVPISQAAREALDSVVPTDGLIFGQHDWRYFLRPAAKRAGLSSAKVATLTPYDLRHRRLLTWADKSDGVDMSGVSFLAGHKRRSTTDIYLRPTEEAAHRLVSGATDQGCPQNGEGDRPTEGADRLHFKGCEEGDLNPHEIALTSTSKYRKGSKAAVSGVGATQKAAKKRSQNQDSGALPPKAWPRKTRPRDPHHDAFELLHHAKDLALSGLPQAEEYTTEVLVEVATILQREVG